MTNVFYHPSMTVQQLCDMIAEYGELIAFKTLPPQATERDCLANYFGGYTQKLEIDNDE